MARWPRSRPKSDAPRKSDQKKEAGLQDGDENGEIGTGHPFEEDQRDREHGHGGQEPPGLFEDVSELFSEHSSLQ